jgi:hypothetical protein
MPISNVGNSGGGMSLYHLRAFDCIHNAGGLQCPGDCDNVRCFPGENNVISAGGVGDRFEIREVGRGDPIWAYRSITIT